MSSDYQRFVDSTIAHIQNWDVTFEEIAFTIRHNIALQRDIDKTQYLIKNSEFLNFIKTRFGVNLSAYVPNEALGFTNALGRL